MNVHRNNKRTHAILEMSNDTDILLIQEPWWGTIATQRLDSDPNGTHQYGPPIHGKWDLHLPKHNGEEKCKVIAYTKKRLTSRIMNNLRLPHTNPSTLILDIQDDDEIIMRLINVYHDAPRRGHSLTHIFQAPIEELIPTMWIGDFNSHGPRWSLPNRSPSTWNNTFEDWMDNTGLTLLNPPGVATWVSARDDTRPSILDLALANEAAAYSNQLSKLDVSMADSLRSDHAMLTLHVYPLDSLALIPLPQPKGY